jgi:putative transposase
MLKTVQLLRSLLLILITTVAQSIQFLRLSLSSRAALSAEVLFLRKQLAFYQERQISPRKLTAAARFSLVLWSRFFHWRDALMIVKPETLIGWHRKGFKLWWRWKSRLGRPRIPDDLRRLIVRMVRENPTWGEERAAAELSVKPGILVSPRTVRAYWPQSADRRAGGEPPHSTGEASSGITPRPWWQLISWWR